MTNERLRACLHNPIAVLAWRLAIVYVLLFVLRAIFYLANTDTLGPLSWDEIPALVRGGWLFDTANLCYCYCLFVVLSLLPVRLRERGWYRRMLFGIWVGVTGVVVLMNLADAVYFHYAKKTNHRRRTPLHRQRQHGEYPVAGGGRELVLDFDRNRVGVGSGVALPAGETRAEPDPKPVDVRRGVRPIDFGLRGAARGGHAGRAEPRHSTHRDESGRSIRRLARQGFGGAE